MSEEQLDAEIEAHDKVRDELTALKAAHQDCVSREDYEHSHGLHKKALTDLFKAVEELSALRAELAGNREAGELETQKMLDLGTELAKEKARNHCERLTGVCGCLVCDLEKANQSLDSIRESLKPLCLNQETLDGCVSAVVARLQVAEESLSKLQDENAGNKDSVENLAIIAHELEASLAEKEKMLGWHKERSDQWHEVAWMERTHRKEALDKGNQTKGEGGG